jgi:16S rRNA (uracil1498-N3)-methyltransferase
VFVADIDDPQLAADDLHHLARVMRLRAGERVSCSDGRGAWRACEFNGAALVPTGLIERTDAPTSHVYVAIPKGDRLDWMVQKLTEVGAASITLVDFERSVVRWSADRVEKGLLRLQRIAREASSQSRRAWLPAIVGPIGVTSIPTEGVVFADPDGQPLAPGDAHCALVIGPEGGFTPAELAGRATRSIGAQVLRVETAAVVAVVASTLQRDR